MRARCTVDDHRGKEEGKKSGRIEKRVKVRRRQENWRGGLPVPGRSTASSTGEGIKEDRCVVGASLWHRRDNRKDSGQNWKKKRLTQWQQDGIYLLAAV